MSLTNAQAALQAAATIYAGSKGYAIHTHVTVTAYRFLTWLDQHTEQVGK